MKRKGRQVGERHYKAQLTDLQVREIRSKYFAYVTGYTKLAKEYNVGVSTIRDICQRRTRMSAGG